MASEASPSAADFSPTVIRQIALSLAVPVIVVSVLALLICLLARYRKRAQTAGLPVLVLTPPLTDAGIEDVDAIALDQHAIDGARYSGGLLTVPPGR